MWHRVAPILAKRYALVIPDLPGYGRSYIPPTTPDHAPYSKRAMAAAMVAVMRALGHDWFAVMGHDRGGRVAYRMALDHPEHIARLGLLDIVATLDVWETLDRDRAMRMWHWPFLAQPAPFPENMIAGDARAYLESRFARYGGPRPAWLSDDVFDGYWAWFRDPARLHATCEDYRAGAGCDLDHDRADRAAGKRIDARTLVLWGSRGNLASYADPLALWRPRIAGTLQGHSIDSGHFIPEENPRAVVDAWENWVRGIGLGSGS
jgi:haloacetate dehalogenase